MEINFFFFLNVIVGINTCTTTRRYSAHPIQPTDKAIILCVVRSALQPSFSLHTIISTVLKVVYVHQKEI